MPFALFDFGTALMLGLALLIVFAFEFVNGFHDTANAVATVIYTNSLRPWVAVIWSGICNFAGVFFGGIAVAYAIVHLLPVDLLVDINTRAGLAMVFALLISAIVWNFGTWYLALPASSSHALIGSILGVGLANSALLGRGWAAGVNWSKAGEVALALLLSPLVGFLLAAVLLGMMKLCFRSPELYSTPRDGQPPPWWIRATLIFTCTGVSVAHGSNDGQKGVGLVMLILIGFLPAQYALNLSTPPQDVAQLAPIAAELDEFLAHTSPADEADHAAEIRRMLGSATSLEEVSAEYRWQLRAMFLHLDAHVRERMHQVGSDLQPEDRSRLNKLRKQLLAPTEHAPTWVLLGVALALGLGTMIGWQRIVVTVGEKIGKAHLTYGQGAAAELVAMTSIGMAVWGGMPVSTTHVLSSAVAGTMVANRSGVQADSVNKILLAWVLTLPATMAMSAGLLCVFRLL